MSPAVSVEQVGKRYKLGVRRHDTLRDRIVEGLRTLWQRDETDAADFWALQDVSFSVNPGEVVGVIGRNGAGKSTLLKLLSRITDPTRGKISLRGRVASLLEVGTGFHPELSGRENIFLNGAILGMTRNEVRRKFDEIVAFAEVEPFIDTPVKRYSSGMYVRLAFAVAAHLECEILLVDEVLAVGDAAFQKKCLGKMEDVTSREGRTILFVSHDTSAISTLSSRCVLLSRGRLEYEGPTRDAISRYLASGATQTPVYVGQSTGGNRPYLARAEVVTSEKPGVQSAGKPMKIVLTLQHPVPVRSACVSFQIFNQFQQPATHLWIFDSEVPYARQAGTTVLTCTMPKVRLNVGQYTLKVYFTEPRGGEIFDTPEGICPFEVVRLDDAIQWGWRPDVCTYHEDGSWTVSAQTTDLV